MARLSDRAQQWGFTLIELLIVVAIIAILAAIAMPNFREAQVRAKAVRAQSDMRVLAGALDTYRVDCGVYPQAEINGTLKYLFHLTTPVAYLTDKNINDPFTAESYGTFNVKQIATFRYYGFDDDGVLNTRSATGDLFSPRDEEGKARIHWYMLFSHGPNGVRDNLSDGPVSGTFVKSDNIASLDKFICFVYDPSNGSRSEGEIFRSGGSAVGVTAPAARFVMNGR